MPNIEVEKTSRTYYRVWRDDEPVGYIRGITAIMWGARGFPRITSYVIGRRVNGVGFERIADAKTFAEAKQFAINMWS
jgi:hypothetical protein